MADASAVLDKQIAALEANLRLIDERLAEFVLSTNPQNLQLVKEKRELEAQLADLYAPASAPAPSCAPTAASNTSTSCTRRTTLAANPWFRHSSSKSVRPAWSPWSAPRVAASPRSSAPA